MAPTIAAATVNPHREPLYLVMATMLSKSELEDSPLTFCAPGALIWRRTLAYAKNPSPGKEAP
jgi:hypothetical protein